MDNAQKVIGYKYSDVNLLVEALTHSSYVNEHGGKSYERLEFLGDALVDFIVGEYFFEKFPNYPEGELTSVRKMAVCEDELCVAKCMENLSEFVRLGKGASINDKIKADVFEAITASIYLDGGLENARKFVIRNVDLMPESLKERHEDYKSILSETVRKIKKTLRFEVLSTSGLDHEKTYEVGAYICDELISRAKSNSKKKAEQLASKLAIAKMRK